MATKIKTRFFCQECGYETAKWLGQCPGCKAWNSLVEEPVSVTAGGKEKKQVLSGVQSAPAVLNEISMEEERRTETGMGELDRVLGGGIVTGSLTLVGGDPGIGKSTLLLQMCRNLSLKKAAHFVCIRRGILTPDQNACDADRRFFGHAGAVL